MPSTTLYAAAHISGDAGTPGNALGAPDGSWTTNSGGSSWVSRWAMDDPPETALEGAQSVTVRIRREASGGRASELEEVNLYQSGALVAQLLASAVEPVDQTGQDVLVGFNGGLITDGSAVEIEVVAGSATGNPNQRRSLQIDAITWLASYSEGEPEPEGGTIIKAWDGGQWVAGTLKRWNGTGWEDATLKRWNGTGWTDEPGQS